MKRPCVSFFVKLEPFLRKLGRIVRLFYLLGILASLKDIPDNLTEISIEILGKQQSSEPFLKTKKFH